MSKLRTINQAYQIIKENDPDTAISKTYLRKILTDGTIKTIRSGNKTLVNMDLIEEYFNSPRGAED